MSRSTFSGPIRSFAGSYTQGPNSVINIPDATNTITLTVADHAGRWITTNDASLVITLPAIVATAQDSAVGPGDPNTLNNQGASFWIWVETTATALSIATNGTDKYVGALQVLSVAAVTGYVAGATNDFINMNGTTSGGVAGSWVRITALKSLKYMVEGLLLGSGVAITPFADA